MTTPFSPRTQYWWKCCATKE